jgi:hypothetical protein
MTYSSTVLWMKERRKVWDAKRREEEKEDRDD